MPLWGSQVRFRMGEGEGKGKGGEGYSVELMRVRGQVLRYALAELSFCVGVCTLVVSVCVCVRLPPSNIPSLNS